ncbi:MAG: hypothetical protein GY839_20905 [candidate division Zixibacteria bacterium]|nr:hypothetical protein [candidate division Zixibacteria bacterium]
MARITVVIDDVINLSTSSPTGEPKPAKVAALCDMAGAGGVAINIKDGNITPNYERIIRGIKEVLGIPLALMIPADDRAVDKAIDLAPGIVVLDDIVSGDGDFVSRLQVSNIIVAIQVSSELDQVKAAAKMKADYVAIDVSSFCAEKSLTTRVDAFNKISKAAALAERLSIGAIAVGPMTLTDLAKLAEIEPIEDFFIGPELMAKALMYGLEDSIADFKSEINRY